MLLPVFISIASRVNVVLWCKGDLLAEGFAVDQGELALGHNLLVAFMPWKGLNYERYYYFEKLLHKDYFTSIHIDITK